MSPVTWAAAPHRVGDGALLPLVYDKYGTSLTVLVYVPDDRIPEAWRELDTV